MNLAAILGFYLLSVGSLQSPVLQFLAYGGEPVPTVGHSTSNAAQSQGNTSSSNPSSSNPSSSPPQALPAQNPSPIKAPAGQDSAKSNPAPAKPHLHAKKAIYPDCSSAPTALNPVLNAKNVAKPDSGAQSAAGANSGIANRDSAKSATPANSPLIRRCPPPKKVVKNGGADEPKIELLSGTPAEQAATTRSTEQITATTEENLKKIEGRQLNSSEQETVSQIKQFLEGSKQATTAGDPERAQNLATKARLLSEELLKP